MPIKMKSLKSHRYGTRHLTAGQEYEVPGESMARLHKAMKWAERAPTVAAPAPAPAPEPVPQKWRRKTPEQKLAPLVDTAPTAPVGTPNPDPDKPVEPVEHGLVGTVRRYVRRDLTPSSED
jgi:hypothetical protein